MQDGRIDSPASAQHGPGTSGAQGITLGVGLLHAHDYQRFFEVIDVGSVQRLFLALRLVRQISGNVGNDDHQAITQSGMGCHLCARGDGNSKLRICLHKSPASRIGDHQRLIGEFGMFQQGG